MDRLVLLMLCVCSTGCASWYAANADREGNAIRDDKAAMVAAFQQTQLLDPRDDLPELEAPAPNLELPEVVGLQECIRIATSYNREYQSRRENFFLSALDLSLVRRDFLRPVFSGVVGYSVSDGRERSYSDSTSLSVGATQFLYTGGRLSVDGTSSLSKDGKGGRDQDALVSGRVSLSQPLLRGAGHKIAFEPLTQAERNTLYDARNFELFRQTFMISIVQDYYALVSQKKQNDNLRRNIEDQLRSVRQAAAKYRVGRGTRVDQLRAEQSYYGTQIALRDAEQSYEFDLDRFKIRLGLPTETRLEVGEELPEDIQPIEINVTSAVTAALNNRLDLLTRRDMVDDQERQLAVSKNSLLPDLNVAVSYETANDPSRNFNSLSFRDDVYTATVNLELPFDRKRERNNYRRAQIFLDQSRRDLEEFEDGIILGVRDSLRGLRQLQEQIGIDLQNIESLKKRVRQAEILNNNGTASNRDITEAQDELTVARNQQLDRYVSYEITRLNLLRQMGVLFVNEEGLIVE